MGPTNYTTSPEELGYKSTLLCTLAHPDLSALFAVAGQCNKF